jgi:hypothetical protein
MQAIGIFFPSSGGIPWEKNIRVCAPANTIRKGFLGVHAAFFPKSPPAAGSKIANLHQ